MENFNVGAGLNQQVLNNLSKNIYDSVYPDFFKGKKEINQFNIQSVSWDIKKPPVFDLTPSEKTKSFLKDRLNKTMTNTTLIRQLEDYIDESVITFELKVPSFAIAIESVGGKTSPPIDGSISVYLEAEVDTDDKLTASITNSEVDIPGEPSLVWIINNIVLPEVEGQLNKILLKGIQLPELKFGDVVLSTPVPSLDNETLLVFAALSSQGATVPPKPGSAWPRDRFLALSDKTLVDTVAAEALKGVQKSGNASTKIAIIKLEARYSVGIDNPDVEFSGGSKLNVGVDAFGSGSVKVKADFGIWKPSVTLGLSVKASPEIKGDVQVNTSNNVIAKFLSVNDFKVELDFSGVPSWLDKFISEITSFLVKPITQLIGSLVSGISFKVYQIPEFKINENGIHLDILVSGIKIDTLTDSGNKKLLTVTGEVEVKKS